MVSKLVVVSVVVALAAAAFYVLDPLGGPANFQKPTGRATEADLMSALVLTSTDGPDAMKVMPVLKPRAVGAGQVLVQVAYVGVNPADYMFSIGAPLPGTCKPSQSKWCGIGLEGSGIVVSVGPNVTKYKPGDRVFGANKQFAAEYAVFDVRNIEHVPAGWTLAEAACITAAYSTTLASFLDDCPNFESNGKWALIVGGATATGTAGIQLAKGLGKQVVAICGENSLEYCSRHGADEVLGRNMVKNWTEALSEFKFDLVYETRLTPGIYDAVRHSKPCHIMIDFGDNVPRALFDLAKRRFVDGANIFFHSEISNFARAERIVSRIEKNVFQRFRFRVFPYTEASEVIKMVKEGKIRGRAVLEFKAIE